MVSFRQDPDSDMYGKENRFKDPDPLKINADLDPSVSHLGDGAGLVELPRIADITDGTHRSVGHGPSTADLIAKTFIGD